MSHVAAIDILIKKDKDSLNAVRAACKELGLVFCENQQTFEWFGRWVEDYNGKDAAYQQGIKPEDYGKCVHAIKLPNCEYEIGVVNRPDGKGYTLVYDFWGPGQAIVKALGKGCEKFKQLYGVHRATIAAKARGLVVQRTAQANGSIKLNILGV